MATPPSDPDIQKLLAELRSKDAKRRAQAAKQVQLRQLQNAGLHNALKVIAETDPNEAARSAAQAALASLGTSGPALTRKQKIQDFTVGFVGWFLINGLAYLLLSGGGANMSGAAFWGILLFPLNIVVLLVLAFSRRWVARRWVALGMLSAIALNFVVALTIGVAIAGWCFIPFFMPLPHN